jgi:site-specific recombinase XerD
MARWGVVDVPTWRTIEAALAPTTSRSYKSTFSAFLTYINEVGRDMTTVRIIDVLSFLQELVDKKRAESTIRQAYAALLHYFVLYERTEIIKSPVVLLHVRGAQRLAPKSERVPFIWDPEVPLTWISQQPLPATFRRAGQEALLLLLLATGIRVSDAGRLSRRMSKSGLSWVIPYLENRKTGPSAPQLVKAYSISRLCPARAIQRYLVKARAVRAENEPFLFISSLGTRASVDTLRTWVVELLEETGIKATAGSCRSASTSAAVLRNLDIDIVMKSAGWAKESTFRRYYQRALLPVLDCESLLPQVE